MLSNILILIKLLKIDANDVENLGPYFQTQSKAKKGVQIDLLIQCKRGILHLCEIKSGALVELAVIDEVKQKNDNLKKPKGFAIINHLICLGQVSNSVIEADFFDKIITGDKILDFEEG